MSAPKTTKRKRGPFAVLRRAKSMISAPDMERDLLLEDSERLETWSAYLVFGGILLEAIVAISPLGHRTTMLGNFLADAAVAAGVYGELRFGHIVGDVFNLKLADADLRVGHLELETAFARETAAKAELETEKVRAQFGWRLITPDQQEYLIAVLSRTPASIKITFAFGDVESAQFARQFLYVFLTASWRVILQGATFAFVESNLRVPAKGDAAKGLLNILQALGFECADLPLPQAAMTSGVRVGDAEGRFEEVEMYVGPKPMPWDISQLQMADEGANSAKPTTSA